MTNDPLSDLARHLRLSARVFLHAEFCGRWAVDASGQHSTTFHLIARGDCWLHLPGNEPPIALHGGDLVMFPHDARHTISNSAEPPDPALVNRIPGVGEGPTTSLVCGYVEFDTPVANPVLSALPDVLHVPAQEGEANGTDAVIRLMIGELEGQRPGVETVVDRYADALFIHLLRIHMARGQGPAGFLAALADPYLRRALACIHEAPQEAWTVDGLAAEASLSRAAFADRFQRLVGMPPARYLTHWRMHLAAERLRSTGDSVEAIAEALGYESDAAFRKAFGRVMGLGPGAFRRRAMPAAGS